MIRTLLAIAGFALLLALGGLALVYAGCYDVAATSGDPAPLEWLFETTRDRSIAAREDEAPAPPDVGATPAHTGFSSYHEMCVVCHGGPGLERGVIGQGLSPLPPDLADGPSALSDRALFRVIKHGIRLAGMPAFGPTHDDAEIWRLVAAVRRLPATSPEEYRLRVDEALAAGGHTHDEGGAHEHAPDAPPHVDPPGAAPHAHEPAEPAP